MIVYKATNQVNSKMYIGYTVRTLQKRKTQHLHDAKHHRYKSVFHRAIRKYGDDVFEWIVLHAVDNEDVVKQLEIDEILKHKSLITENGYNMTQGGTGFASGKLNHNYINPRYGKDNSFYGKKHTKESRELMSKNAYVVYGTDNYFGKHKFVGDNNHFYGKTHTNDTKQKIGNANSSVWKITSPDSDDTTIVKNLHTFCKEHDLNYSGVKSSARNKKPYKGGFLFEKLS